MGGRLSWPPELMDEYLQMRERERRRHFASTGDVAEWLGVSPSTVRSWCEAGRLPHVRIGARRLIDVRFLKPRRRVRRSKNPFL